MAKSKTNTWLLWFFELKNPVSVHYVKYDKTELEIKKGLHLQPQMKKNLFLSHFLIYI